MYEFSDEERDGDECKCPKCSGIFFEVVEVYVVRAPVGLYEVRSRKDSQVLRCANPDCGARVEFLMPGGGGRSEWEIGRVWAR